MEVKFGASSSEYGPGVAVELTGDEIDRAITTYLHAHGVYISGARTVRVNGDFCGSGRVFVDPSGFVMHEGRRYNGRGTIDE